MIHILSFSVSKVENEANGCEYQSKECYDVIGYNKRQVKGDYLIYWSSVWRDTI